MLRGLAPPAATAHTALSTSSDTPWQDVTSELAFWRQKPKGALAPSPRASHIPMTWPRHGSNYSFWTMRKGGGRRAGRAEALHLPLRHANKS